MTHDSTSVTPRDFVFAFFEARGPIPGTSEAEQGSFDYVDGVVLDSFGIVEMVTELETQFGIAFSPEDLQSPEFRTIGGLIAMVERHLRSSQAS